MIPKLLKLSRGKVFFSIYGILLVLLLLAFFLGAVLPLVLGTKDMMVPPVFLLLFPAPFILYVCHLMRLRWMWLVGHALYPKLEDQIRIYFTLFRASIMVPVIMLSFLVLGILWMMMESSIIGTLSSTLGVLVLWFIPILGMLYSSFFNAKILKSNELGRTALITDYFVDFLLFFFLIIGIWNLHPRIQAQLATPPN